MKKSVSQIASIALLMFILISCNLKNSNPASAQSETKKLVGGGCDGCELMYAGMPGNINATDTSVGWYEKGQKLLVTGTVYQGDGKTPASNVIIYYWHTDNNGYYSPREGMNQLTKRHGHIRGWIKTGENGQYSLYTIRPAPYPNEKLPSHIHTSIKEPGIENEYYIDEFVFDDDALLTADKRNRLENRGGSGILKITLSGDMQVAHHDIILGLNIPGYPVKPNP